MSDTDSFIEEVSEEVRRDRLFKLYRRYGWIAALLVLLLVGGAAWNEWRKAQDRVAAEAAGDALLGALETQDAGARIAALEDVAAEGAAGAVARLLEAAAAVEADDTATAIAALDTVAGDAALPVYYRDLATLKSVILQTASLAPDARIALLEPLTAAGAPFRVLAEEQIALAEIDLGDRDGALDRLRALADDTEATAGLRRRASELIVALGGDGAAG